MVVVKEWFQKYNNIFFLNQYLVLLPASIPIGTLAQSQGFCRIIVRGMINQLYQTGANDHQCRTQVETVIN